MNLHRRAMAGMCAVMFTFTATAEDYRFTTYAGYAPHLGHLDIFADSDTLANDGVIAGPQFNSPCGLALDGAGNLYVADTENHTIRKITPAGVVTTLAGSAGQSGAVNGPAAIARFNAPFGVAVNALGDVFVSDTGNHAIRKISNGVVSTFAGALGESGIVDGSATTARLFKPRGIAIDSAGNLFVAGGTHEIRRIAVNGAVTTLAGAIGQPSFADGIGAVARFNTPWHLAIDPSANLYVVDLNNDTLRKVTPSGVVTTLPGAHGLQAVAADANGNVYLSGALDGVLGGGYLPRITPAGVWSRITIVPDMAARSFPITGLLADRLGNLYTTDAVHSIRKITPDGKVSLLAGSPYQRGGADGTGVAARFVGPGAIIADAAGTLYLADGASLRRITAAGVVTTVAGVPDSPGAVDGLGSAARIGNLAQLALDTRGNILLADYQNHAIRRVTTDGAVTTIAGKLGKRGYGPGWEKGELNCALADALFDLPSGVGVSGDGTIFVSDFSNGALRMITTRQTVEWITNAAGPSRILCDGSGNVYYVDLGLKKATPPRDPKSDWWTISDVSPAVLGQTLNSICWAGGGTIFATDGNTVKRIESDGSVTTLAGKAIESTNDLDYYVDGVGAEVRFSNTRGVAAVGNTIYVADWGNRMIRQGVPATGAGTGGGVVPGGGLNVGQTALAVRNTRAGGSFLWGIAAGPGGLVTVGDGGTILSSPDGVTWTRRTSGVSDWLVAVAYGNSQYVAVGDKGRVLLSRDGSTWTSAPQTVTTGRLNNLLYGAGTFVAVGEGGTIITSVDGRTWTARNSGVTGWLRGLAYTQTYNYTFTAGTSTVLQNGALPARFIAVGEGGSFIASPTGETWSAVTSGLSVAPRAGADVEAVVTIKENTIAAVGANGLLVYSSYVRPFVTAGFPSPLFTLAQTSIGVPVRYRGLIQGANALFAMGENGTLVAAPGPTGPWTRIASGTTANLVNGVFFNNALFIVGENETILQTSPLYHGRLTNISTRGQVGTDGNIMITGFVVSGPASKTMLVRSAGPALGAFGVGGVLTAPSLTLFDGNNRAIASNSGWGSASNSAAIATATVSVGAFPFPTGSADSAVLITVNAGNYTAHVAGANNATGIALIEVYDVESIASDGPRAINISTRGTVGGAGRELVAGFTIAGAPSRRLLIRAVGPTLRSMGVADALARPEFKLFQGSTLVETIRGPWSADANQIRSATLASGAFALEENSLDAALVTSLAPGSWTVQVSSADNTTGVALVEVYDLP